MKVWRHPSSCTGSVRASSRFPGLRLPLLARPWGWKHRCAGNPGSPDFPWKV